MDLCLDPEGCRPAKSRNRHGVQDSVIVDSNLQEFFLRFLLLDKGWRILYEQRDAARAHLVRHFGCSTPKVTTSHFVNTDTHSWSPFGAIGLTRR